MTTDIQSMFDAVANQDTDAIKNLLANGADINAASKNGLTALHLAAECALTPVTQMLLECGADINARTDDGHTALYYAVNPDGFCSFSDAESERFKRESTVLTRMLLEHGADPNVEADDGSTPLSRAVTAINAENVRLLLEHGADVQQYWRYKNAEHLLAHLAKKPWSYSMKADPWDNSSPAGDRIFQLLLEHGCEFDAKLLTSDFYLAEAVLGGMRHVAAFMLMHGADANEPVRQHQEDDVFSALLLEEFAESDESKAVVDEGHTVLHAAAALRQPDIAALLLEHGANPNTANAKRETPLHISVRSGNWPITKLLLQHGANPHAKNKSSKSPLDLEEDKDLQALMLKHAKTA